MGQRSERAVDVRAVGRFVVRGTRRAALTFVGFALVALGLAGLVLPVLPGWILIIGGFAVLSREYSWAHAALSFARRQANRSGTKIRAMATRRRRTRFGGGADHSAEVVIDLAAAERRAGDRGVYDRRAARR